MKISIQFTAAEKSAIRNFFITSMFHFNNLASSLGKNGEVENIGKMITDMDKDLDKETLEISLPETATTYTLEMAGKMLAPMMNFIIGIIPLLGMLKNTLKPLIAVDEEATKALRAIMKAYDLSKKDSPIFDVYDCEYNYTNLYKAKVNCYEGFSGAEVSFATGFWIGAYAKLKEISNEEAHNALDKIYIVNTDNQE